MEIKLKITDNIIDLNVCVKGNKQKLKEKTAGNRHTIIGEASNNVCARRVNKRPHKCTLVPWLLRYSSVLTLATDLSSQQILTVACSHKSILNGSLPEQNYVYYL